ncbi:5-methylcytosine restriction system specificity protein McrC, partial [Rothia nasimurium]
MVHRVPTSIGIPIRINRIQRCKEQGIADVSHSPREGCFNVSVKQVAGQVSFEGSTFSIAPKLPVCSVIWMMQQAYVPLKWKGEHTPLNQESLICAMAQMYRTLVEGILAGGLLQGYVSVQEHSSVLRGRLLLNEQLTRHYGNLYPFETSYQKFGVNIPVNQVLLTAAVHLMHLLEQDGRFSDEALAYRRFLQSFDGVQSLVPGQVVPDVVFTRLNQHYEQVFRWAAMVLQQIGFSATAGVYQGSGFVVNMATVFEVMVGNILVSHYPAGAVLICTGFSPHLP